MWVRKPSPTLGETVACVPEDVARAENVHPHGMTSLQSSSESPCRGDTYFFKYEGSHSSTGILADAVCYGEPISPKATFCTPLHVLVPVAHG